MALESGLRCAGRAGLQERRRDESSEEDGVVFDADAAAKHLPCFLPHTLHTSPARCHRPSGCSRIDRRGTHTALFLFN